MEKTFVEDHHERNQMLVDGVREWFGEDARIFMQTRNKIENTLLKLGYKFFYPGIVSKKSIYEENVSDLGEKFLNNCIEFMVDSYDNGIIISPEGTFRVYEFLHRNQFFNNKRGKVFYSQEFLRNETLDDIREGKTFSFWQTGFEIYGYDEIESSLEVLSTAIECFDAIHLKDATFRITDKRLLKGILLKLPLNKQRAIYELIDKCKDNGDLFEMAYTKAGGNQILAHKIGDFLKLGELENLTLEKLDAFTDNPFSHDGIQHLEQVFQQLSLKYPNQNIKLVPFMGKSWDACNKMMFDVRLPGYNFAVAGGGDLCAYNKGEFITKSGAGIGVTRLTEYMVEKRKGHR